MAGLLFFKIRIQIGRILSISIFSIVLITAWNIAQAYTCIYEYQKSHLPSYAKGILSYSKSKENVIIIVMDMFTGGHIEKMIADPWFDNFKKTMDGFTWYPDTISASAVTIMSLPSIYGGHNYLPDNQNKEKSFTLNEKINKAFALLPRNFSQNGYHVHIINGLPYETEDMMLDTIKHLNTLDIQGIKIHMLNIVKDTPLETLYNKEHFHILSKDEYIDIVIKQLELLNSKIVIHRITSDPDVSTLIEPTWLIKKFCLLNDIDKEMVKRDTYQGKYY